METSQAISTDKATVVIQVNPQVNTVVREDGPEAGGVYHNTALKGFFKVQPKALGTVQIMIGVMSFLLGIVLTTNINRFSIVYVVSGITYWGSFIYISAGSLSVVAQNNLNPCVVKASLGMNVISAITAGLSILLMAIQMRMQANYYYYYSGSEYFEGYDWGISGILLLFSILQFIISICISGFACKATCNRDNDSRVVNVALNQRY